MAVNFKKRKATDFIVIHCAATKPSMDIGVHEIRLWHHERGFLDIGYHFVIRRDGTVETGRPVDVMGAGVKGHNDDSVHICMVGGVSEDDVTIPEDNFTEAQWDSLEETVSRMQRRYVGQEPVIVGHNELDPNKACPSFNVAHWELTRPVK